MQEKNKIPFLEKPNIEEINNNIKESGLVLCLSLNEKESVSLISPSNYYIYVQRYMYLSNIIPKCLEYFKSFILPFYGNKCGVYFECFKNKKENLDDDSNNENRENKNERIILDWRLPIGVLFDIYCDIESENTYINEKKQNLKFCSSNELFNDYVNIIKVPYKEINNSNNIIIKETNDTNENNYTLNKDATKDSINYNSEVEFNNEIDIDLNNDNIKDLSISKNMIQAAVEDTREVDELKKKYNENICNDKIKNDNHKIREKAMGINVMKKCNEMNYKSKEEFSPKHVFNNTQENSLEFDKNFSSKIRDDISEYDKDYENKENNKKIYEKNMYFKNDSRYYKLIMRKEINNEWYEKQFLSISNKNIPWKLIVHFKGEEDYPYYDSNKNDKKGYNGNINVLSYNSCIPLYRGFSDFEEHIINQLKKASYIFSKSNRLLQMLPQQIEKKILCNLKNFNVENICSLYREYIDYNMIKFIDYFNNEFIEKINYFFVCTKSIENNPNKENKEREETNIKGEKYDNYTFNKKLGFSDEIEENIKNENEYILNKNDCNNENRSTINNDVSNQTNDSKDFYLSDNNMIKNTIINSCINNANGNNYSNINFSVNTYNNGLHIEKKYKQNNDNLVFTNINKENSNCRKSNSSFSHGNYSKEKCITHEILKDEKLVKEVPIIIHIYGPPYNQIITKFPLFKIIYSEKNKNVIEEFFLYTLGDFLHEMFPSFFRKIKKEKKKNLEDKVDIENKEIGDKIKIREFYNENVKLNIDEKKKEKYINNPKNMYDIYLNSETIFYFEEDYYLIFSDYMFIMINGIQIPLKTPLYWLTTNFAQFDNFLHIILRIPSY
ncbi:autophagy protein 5, putative [Plasmodium relictum]|uniref:Autophagy protein 5 n=1 Tax=Plasmodium relictum TaxID=85471 RepID=A0A1J1HCY9_PLARL|nr:autophagy protein 5, putative [Plasmodium relictum]CRH03848.1 autophagy protein 5, putative [Plasmodium relictum]